MEAIERHHIERELRYGRYHILPPHKSVPWASRVHIVKKPHADPPLGQDGFGRMVVEYRHANKGTRKKHAVMTDQCSIAGSPVIKSLGGAKTRRQGPAAGRQVAGSLPAALGKLPAGAAKLPAATDNLLAATGSYR